MLLAGVSFGFFVMVPYAIYFLNQNDYTLMSTTSEYYLTFMTGLCLLRSTTRSVNDLAQRILDDIGRSDPLQ